MTIPLQTTDDGYEKTYQVNYLAPFLLTTSLLDVLIDSHAAVINTSSSSHKLLRRVNVADFENTQRYRPSKAYALTKLGIVLFTMELHRRYHGAGLSAAAFDPGYVDSNFGPRSGSRFIAVMSRTPVRRLTASADEAADQLVWLSTTMPGTDWKSGEYYARHRIAKANRRAYDPELARELWDRSLAIIRTES
jgi:NAD(P)-dependent dehydrogenase (short-subunit alcohol dehydrogenase family)